MMMKRPLLSVEFFPTITEEGALKLDAVRESLSVLPWEYHSVTYGAGGSTRERTMQTVQRICQEHKVVMPHLTCIAAQREDLSALLREYATLGIHHLMALRGDMPSGMYQVGDMEDVRDLIRLTREIWGEQAEIYVAAYPEIHPRAKSPEADLHFFCEKMRAGANHAVTQYFFNADSFFRFRDEVSAQGIEGRLIPGIMPISNYTQLARFSDACGADIPRWLRKRLEQYQDDLPSLIDFGVDVIAQLCQRLIQEEVQALHFYSMNRADIILAIAKRLNWLS